MGLYDYASRLDRPIMSKMPDFQRAEGERLKHVIFSQQFTPRLIENLGGSANCIREIARTKQGHDFLRSLLCHKRAMLYFTQPSTRTFLSFMAACQIMGITCNEVRDPSVSSEAKGESPIDSIRMFSSYFDLIIMRSKLPNFAETCAYLMNDLDQFNHRSVPIINGGAGADEHPTQALLDIYTIQRVFDPPTNSTQRMRFEELLRKHPALKRGIDGKSYAFCGDIGRGRTVRSLAILLSLYSNVTMHFISPEHSKLQMSADLRNRLAAREIRVHQWRSLDDTFDGEPLLSKIDCLYMTRIQQEHNSPQDAASFKQIDMGQYCLTPERVGRMREYAAILHPFPRDSRMNEIPPEIDNDPRSMYFRQARNGMWIRAALLAYLFDVDGEIVSYHRKHYTEKHDYNEGVL